MSSWQSSSVNENCDNTQNSRTIESNEKTSSFQVNERSSVFTNETDKTRNEISESSGRLKHPRWPGIARDNIIRVAHMLSRVFRSRSNVMKRADRQQPIYNPILSKAPKNWKQILEQEFQSLDIDADGFVSVSDLQSVLKNFAHICNSNEVLLRIFDELDINHDQRISKQEFLLYKNILLENEKRFYQSTFDEKLVSTFTLFDRNKDNFISRHEIRDTMHNLGEYVNDELVEEMIQTADFDHDGRISRDEFKNLLIELDSKK